VAVIDLHCHILPGVDDGPRRMSGAVKMARAAVQAGVRTIVATPHVSETFPNRSEDIAAGTAALIVELARRDIALNIRTGAEITITQALDLDDEELAALRLGGGPYLLVECPLTFERASAVETLLLRVQDRGHRVLLAHPERSPAFLREPERLARLVGEGMLTSITAGALGGQFGRRVATFALELVRDGLVHDIASDAHDATRRSPQILEHLMAADRQLPGTAAAADWYAREVPSAILAGRPIGAAATLAGRPSR
jgi:protein-tyrosine phosphatase